MANKKFLESMKKNANQDLGNENKEAQLPSGVIANYANYDPEDESENINIKNLMFSPGNLGDVPGSDIEFNRETGNDVLGLFNKELSINQDMNDENVQDENKITEIEINDAPIFKKRGPKPHEDIPVEKIIVPEIKKIDTKEEETNNVKIIKKIKDSEPLDNIVLELLNYVCNKTIEYMSKNYKSKIYTEEYTGKLFKEYMDEKINSSSPLFEALIDECIDDKIVDPYLDSLTSTVLKYIKDKNK